MVQMTTGDLPELSVEQLARVLLDCARDDPALLARSGPRAVAPPDAATLLPPVPMPRPAAPPLNLPAARSNPEVEELVSIAVNCARRAEDAVRHARQISAAANRRVSMAAVFAGCGVMAASIAIWFDWQGRIANPLTPVVGALHAVTDDPPDLNQPRAGSDIAGVRNQAPGDRVSGDTGMRTAAGALAAPALADAIPRAGNTIAAADQSSAARIATSARATPAVAVIESAEGGNLVENQGANPAPLAPRSEIPAGFSTRPEGKPTTQAEISVTGSAQSVGPLKTGAQIPVTESVHGASSAVALPVQVGSPALPTDSAPVVAVASVPPLPVPRDAASFRKPEERPVASAAQIHPHQPVARAVHARSSVAAANSGRDETTSEEDWTTDEESSVEPVRPPASPPMRPPESMPPPAYIVGYRPMRPPVYREVRVYRRMRHFGYYVPAPPVFLSQVVAGVRRNLYELFH